MVSYVDQEPRIAIDALIGLPVVPRGPATGRKFVMPRIIVMSEPNAEPESAITLDERVTPANLRSGHDSARLIERVGWAVHDADDMEREDGEAGGSAIRPMTRSARRRAKAHTN